MVAFSDTLPWELDASALKDLLQVPSERPLEVVKPSRAFGGYTGDKCLLRNGAEGTGHAFVLLKRTAADLAEREALAYAALHSVGAPVVQFYGLLPLSDGASAIAVEFLREAVDWPIPAPLHLAWAGAAARLASCPIPSDPQLPVVRYRPEADAYLDGIEAAAGLRNQISPPDAESANPTELLAVATDALVPFLEAVDSLPKGLTHGECYSMHMGRRVPDGEVLFFDVTSAAVRPRCFDVQGLIVDHGEPYEIGDTSSVLARFLESYSPPLPWEAFTREVAMIEGLIALRHIGLHVRLLSEGRGEAWQNTDEKRAGHIKWIRLSTRKARETLSAWMAAN